MGTLPRDHSHPWGVTLGCQVSWLSHGAGLRALPREDKLGECQYREIVKALSRSVSKARVVLSGTGRVWWGMGLVE